MRTHLLFCFLFLFSYLGATEIPVSPSTFSDAYVNAADGDVLLLEPGVYGSSVTFPSGKTITLKAATGEELPEIRFSVSANDVSIAGGGLIFDGVKIVPTGDYFISLDNVGDIASILVRNCTIESVNRCFIRTNNTGYSIGEIEFTNCIIRNCGDKGWNFMYPKHSVRKVSVRNSTLYNYPGGESLFFANASDANNVMEFLFENNTVYKWAKSSDRALCKTGKNYSVNSNYVFRNNIIAEPGVEGQTPCLLEATGGNVTGENNLIVNYGGYKVSNAVSQQVNDLTLEGLGLASIGFPDPNNGDFTILSTSPLATAGVDGKCIGDPRWIKALGEAVHLETAVLPEGSGSVSPVSIAVEKGENATLTATANYGFRFKLWQDESGKTLSTENPATLQIDKDIKIVAVFDAMEMHTLTVNFSGEGAKWGKVLLSPEVEGNNYEKGTIVTVTAVENPVSTFMYWEDQSGEKSRQVIMDSDRELTASFDVIPFIVGWDFAVSEPRGNRPGDYYFKTDNTGNLSLYDYDGSSTNWGGSNRTFGGIAYDCARRYTGAADIKTAPRYFQAKFSAQGYTNIQVKSMIAADNVCVHKLQKMQYSTNGTDFFDLVTIDMTGKMNAEWIACDATLPAVLTGEEKATVYIRWIPDLSSELLGEPDSGATEGFYLANLFVYADEEYVEDPNAPELLGTVPAEGSSTASANGTVIFTFNEKVKAGTVPVVFNGETVTPVFGSKTASYAYKNLAYGTPYEFVLPAGAITDIAGNPFPGVTLRFSTMERPQPIARVFDAVVAADGTGDYTTVQAAINAAPEGRTMPWLIFVKNGSYKEQVIVPANKSFIHLIGQEKGKTIIHHKLNVGGQPEDKNDEFWKYSVHNPASEVYQFEGTVVQVNATDFYSENISYVNDWGVDSQAGPQALAMSTQNDRSAFFNCEFRSFQDTWMTSSKNDNNHRTYVTDCWLEGAVDYFYGGGNAYVENTTFYNVRSGSVIVAPSHGAGTRWGYIFDRCTVDGNALAADGKQKLGRPWHNSPITVYMNTTMNIPIAPEGWTDMGALPALFAEYNSMDKDGNPLDLSNRKTTYTYGDGQTGSCKAVLTAEDVVKYTYENVVCDNDNWNPRMFIEKVAKPANLVMDGNRLSWKASEYAICYLVFCDGEMIGMTTETSFSAPASDKDASAYQVKAANEYGSLSEPATASKGTGIRTEEVDNRLQVLINGNELYVSGISAGVPVVLAGIDGCIVKNTVSAGDTVTFTLPPLKGVYVLKAGNRSTKIIF
ncbi:pectinesterase family protein [Bacteroides sp.]